MKNLDILNLSTRIFKVNRLRTFLTIVGIGIGIGTILFLVSLGYGVQKVILDRIASSDALLSLDITSPDSSVLPLNPEFVNKVKDYPEVDLVSPVVSLNAQAEANSFQGVVTVNFAKNSYFKLSGLQLRNGKFYGDDQKTDIIVSTAFLKLFDLSGTDIGEYYENNKIKFSIIIPKNDKENEGDEVQLLSLANDYKIAGIIKDDNNPIVFIQYDNLGDNEITIDQFNQIKIKAKDQASAVILRGRILAQGYGASSINEVVDQANKVFRVIQLVLAGFGIIALIVSAIGMFNTMTISLLQRTKEVGIMKSIGAKNKDINKIFLTEALLIGFLGGCAGLAIGFGMQALFGSLLKVLAKTFNGEVVDVFDTPTWFIITIMSFSTFVGLFTGVWPARRAAQLNPLEALRK